MKHSTFENVYVRVLLSSAVPPTPALIVNHTAGIQRSGPGGAYFVNLEIFGPGHSTGAGLAVYNNIPDGGNQDQQPDNFKVLTAAPGNAGVKTWDTGVTESVGKSLISALHVMSLATAP